jgi:hypothetical protein
VGSREVVGTKCRSSWVVSVSKILSVGTYVILMYVLVSREHFCCDTQTKK